MKLGFLTGIMGDIPLTEKIQWAHGIGFEVLEVSCWPWENDRDYAGSDLDVVHLDYAKATVLHDILQQNQMKISTLAYYDNNLDHDLLKRKKYNDHLLAVIDAAALLGVKNVGTFLGRDLTLSIEDNFSLLEQVFRPILEYAQEKKINIIVENCSMPGWHRSGWAGTISYSPELWDEMFRRLPFENFGLNFDPSHLIWLGIDYIEALKEYQHKIIAVHAKDTEIFSDKRNYYSILGKQLRRAHEWDFGFWRHRMPGKGMIDWDRFIATLYAIGYDNELVIEHEDLEYQDTPEQIKEGLTLGYQFLKDKLSRGGPYK
jgi:sugar phosphate isomerase/epimerase